jgi:hypothetical protein
VDRLSPRARFGDLAGSGARRPAGQDFKAPPLEPHDEAHDLEENLDLGSDTK